MGNAVRTVLTALLLFIGAFRPVSATGQIPFIRTTVSTATPFTGEEVLLTYTICFIGDGPKVSDASNPSLKGLWTEELDPGRFVASQPVTVSGVLCRSAIIRQFKLAAIEPGRHVIDGYRVNCIMPGSNMASGNEPLTLVAPTVILQVRALPQPSPEGFSGAVGDFSFAIDTEPPTVKAGEPVKITSSVTGRGNLPSLIIPLPTFPPSLYRGTPIADLSLDKNETLSSGTSRSTLTIYPEKTGKLDFPPVRFVFFDAAAGRYQSVASRHLTVTVVPSMNRGKVNDQKILRSLDREIPEERLPGLPPAGLAAAAFVALGLLFIIGKKISDKHVTKSKRASRDSVIGNETPEMVRNRIYGIICETGVEKPESLTKKQLADTLQRIGVSSETIEKLERLIDMIDRALYSPVRAGNDELRDLRIEAAAIMKELQQKKKTAREEANR